MLLAGIVLLFFLVPAVCSLVALAGYLTNKDPRKVIIYSALLAIIFGVAGYCFKDPATDPDLVRYLQILSTYKGKGLFESFNTAYTNLYAVDILFWIIANIGSPQLLPAVACYIYYFIILYIINDCKVISGINDSYFTIYFLFTIAATLFGSIVNGIRWPMAFSMFLLAIYRDLYKNQRNGFTFFLYVVAFFMHFSVIGLVLVRLAMLIRNKKRVLIYSLGLGLLPQVLQILAEKLGSVQTSIGILNRILYFINRGNMYFQWQGGGWADTVRTSTYYRLEKMYFIAICLLYIYMILCDYRKFHKSKIPLSKVEPIYIYSFTYMILTLVTFLIASHVYIRFITPALPLLSVAFFYNFRQEKGGVETEVSIKKIPVLAVIIGLTLVGVFLNFYFIRTMIDIKQFLGDIFTFNFFTR